MTTITPQQLVNSGLALIPIPLGSKGPNHEGWNLMQNCINNPRKLTDFLGKNIGLAHAYCTPTPTLAIDIDNYHHAKSWLVSHGIDLNGLLEATDAVVIWSGKKYSLKLLYRLPVGQSALESKKIVGLDGKSALEFRCATKDGKTVQDVLPPSIHPEGHQYTWIGLGDPLKIPQIPECILKVWLLLIQNGVRVSNRSSFSCGHVHRRPETPRQVARLEAMLNHIYADCEYQTWRNVIWAILSTGWECSEDVAYKWSKTAPARFEEDSFWLVANSYIPDHDQQITIGTIHHLARIGGWNE
jgi:putative DNA primase/helicase